MSVANPRCYEAGKKFSPLLAQGKTDIFYREVFCARYNEARNLEIYDRILLQHYIEKFPHTETTEDSIILYGYEEYMHNDCINHDYIATRFAINGINYLEKSPFFIDDAQHTELSQTPPVLRLIQELKAKIDTDDGYRLLLQETGIDYRPSLDIARPYHLQAPDCSQLLCG